MNDKLNINCLIPIYLTLSRNINKGSVRFESTFFQKTVKNSK